MTDHVFISMALGLLMLRAMVAEPTTADPTAAEAAWSEAVNDLQCRITQVERSIDPAEALRYSVQFRNASNEELILDATSIHDLALVFLPDQGAAIELRPNKEVRRDLRMPDAPGLIRLKPSEIAAFSRPVQSSFQRHETGYYAPYEPSGKRSWTFRPGEFIQQRTGLRMEVKFVYEVTAERKESDMPGQARSWKGRIESKPVVINFDEPTRSLGPSEWQKAYHLSWGEALANLSCGLVALDGRVVVGRPCWFRFSLRNHSQHPRQYKPLVNLLKPGGLVVTDEQGTALPCLNARAKEDAKLRAIEASEGFVVLCEFDLASAYDLSKPGKYRVQFPTTGGDEEAEAVLPASNVAEVEMVDSYEKVFAGRSGPAQFTLRGTVKTPKREPVAGASVILGPSTGRDYFVTPPHQAESAADVVSARTDDQGVFALNDIKPGSYWVVAKHPGHGAVVGKIGFAMSPDDSYDLELYTGGIYGIVFEQDGKTPVRGARVLLSRQGGTPRTRKPWEAALAVVSDEQGKFEFTGVPEGQYRLSAKLPDQPYENFEKIVTVGEKRVDVELFEPSCTVSGKVISPEGEPVPGAEVSIQPLSPLSIGIKRGQTDANGEFTLKEIGEGKYLLRAYGPSKGAMIKGAAQDRAEMELTFSRQQPNQQAEVRLTDSAGAARAKVSIKVLGLDGEPVRNQNLMMCYKTSLGSGGQRGGRTNNEGVFVHSVHFGGETDITVVAESLNAWGEVSIKLAEGEKEAQATAKLQPCGSASGRVLEEVSGKAIGGIAVTAVPAGLDKTARRQIPPLSAGIAMEHISRDGDGTFRLLALPPGEYEIWLGREDRPFEEPATALAKFKVSARQSTDGIDIRRQAIKDAVSLAGQVIDKDGMPIANREVVLRGAGRTWSGDTGTRRLLTDLKGRFVLYPLQPDFYEFLPFLSGENDPGPSVKAEVKPGRENQKITLQFQITQKPQVAEDLPPPDPAGAWGKPVKGLRTRLTPEQPKFEQFERVKVRIEVENVGKWPEHYDTQGLKRSFRGKAPDGQPLPHVAMPYQTDSSEPGPMVAAGEQQLVGEVELTEEFDFSKPGKYQVQFHSGGLSLPASNVAEIEITARDPQKPLPSISLALPEGFVQSIEAVLPEGWGLGGTDGAWKREGPGFEYPRSVWILCGKTVSTSEAARSGQEGLDYHLLLYDQRLEGEGRAPTKDMRYLGETDWYRVYAKGNPDPRFGWKDPDGDTAKALKLKRPETPQPK